MNATTSSDNRVSGVHRGCTESAEPPDGAVLRPGDRFCTVSGRTTGPFPKQYKCATRDLRALREWLKQEAIAEALARYDDYNLAVWEQLNVNNWSPADGYCVNLYLFDDMEGCIAWRKVDPLLAAQASERL